MQEHREVLFGLGNEKIKKRQKNPLFKIFFFSVFPSVSVDRISKKNESLMAQRAIKDRLIFGYILLYLMGLFQTTRFSKDRTFFAVKF